MSAVGGNTQHLAPEVLVHALDLNDADQMVDYAKQASLNTCVVEYFDCNLTEFVQFE